MSVVFTTILLSAVLTSAPPGNVLLETQDAPKEAQSSTPQTNESKSSKQQPTPSPAQDQESKPAEQAPSQPVPGQSETQPGAKPAEQAPQVPASSTSENPSATQSNGPKPSEAVPPAKKKEASHAPEPTSRKSTRRKTGKKTSAQLLKPRKVIVRNGGTADTVSQLAPDMSTAEASHARDTTNQLLSTTEANLRQASTRQLSKDQLAMVEQIRTFVGQSNAAVKAGDLQRGHNLALKALLLSNDLVKQ